MFTILIRFVELALCSVMLSSASAALWLAEIVPKSDQAVGITFLFGMIIFAILQTVFLRRSYLEYKNRFAYLAYNIFVYFLFAVGSIAARIYLGNVFHTWTFGIYKFMMFANADMTWWQSAIYGHAVMVAIIFLAPIGVRRYNDEYDDDDSFMLGEIDPYDIEYGAEEDMRSPFEGEDDFDENVDDDFFDEDDFDDYDDWE